ncbi:hypothetical protein BKA82DRAFT_4014925 [Pisolithus tinctorius]|nr:hypothetical protein BKA82DRAFT_4014925 [Pisolithus tinctorius]
MATPSNLTRDWIKLLKGLGYWSHSPACKLSAWQNLMVGGFLAHMSQTDLERVQVENGIATDKVYIMGQFAEERSAIMESLKKEFLHEGCSLAKPNDKPVKETGGKEQGMNPASDSKTGAPVDSNKSNVPRLPVDNDHLAKKCKGGNKGKKGKN